MADEKDTTQLDLETGWSEDEVADDDLEIDPILGQQVADQLGELRGGGVVVQVDDG